MTKAERILALYKTGEYTTRQIADVIGCRIEYVRVAARQRKGGGQSEIDHRYLQSSHGQETRAKSKRRWIAANREKHNAYFRDYYHSHPEYRDRMLALKRKRRAEARAS